MVNKLRLYAGLFGGVLAGVSLWGALRYDGPVAQFLAASLVGAAIVATPHALAYGKLLRERRRQASLDESIYASDPLGMERDAFLDAAAAALEETGAYVGVKRRSFPEGDGLIVDHTLFHGTFVRMTDAGRAVVTGVTQTATRSVADTIESAVAATLSRQRANPFLRSIPVRGLPRATLTLVLTAVIVLDAAFVAGLAYPSPAYNPGEKATLVAFDVRAAVDPGVDDTDAKLSKADFLVSVLREEATEIRWQAGIDGTSRATVNDAATISADISRLLAAADGPDLSPSDRERVERIRADQSAAMAAVREAMAAPAPTATPPDGDDPFGGSSTTTTTTATVG